MQLISFQDIEGRHIQAPLNHISHWRTRDGRDLTVFMSSGQVYNPADPGDFVAQIERYMKPTPVQQPGKTGKKADG